MDGWQASADRYHRLPTDASSSAASEYPSARAERSPWMGTIQGCDPRVVVLPPGETDVQLIVGQGSRFRVS
jgi:hypothetical protein